MLRLLMLALACAAAALRGVTAAGCDTRPTLRLNSGYASSGTANLQPDVKVVQQKVGATVDGYFGPGTETKVKTFQGNKCLTVDGIVGPVTWRALCDGYTACSSGGSCTLSNPTNAQSKSSCTNRAVDTGSMCWTDRAFTLYKRIQACYPNIECTTYATAVGSGSDHAGNALDCWAKAGRPCPASGSIQTQLQTLANWGRTNAVAVKIGYINWRQQQWSQGRASEGWRSYADRGGCTANHYDHVHFSVCAGSLNEASYGC